jgi:hypothetical protein
MAYSPAVLLRHLQEYLPRYTDLFSEQIPVAAVIIDDTVQKLRVTIPGHGLSTGNKVVLSSGRTVNRITGATVTLDAIANTYVMRCATAVNHDLTGGLFETVTIQGFTDTALDGDYAFLSSISSDMFEVEVPFDSLPAGNLHVLENRSKGVNGALTITNVVDASTIDIDLLDTPLLDAQQVQGLIYSKNMRINVIANFERVKDIYSKEATADTAWLYLIMGDVAASKDHELENDAIRTDTVQNAQKVKMVGDFALCVMLPTHNDPLGAYAINLCYTEVYAAIIKTIVGVKLDGFLSQYVTSLTDHGPLEYVPSYYGHGYTIQFVYEEDLDSFHYANNFVSTPLQSVAPGTFDNKTGGQ